MYNTPRAATITAATEGTLWALVSNGCCSDALNVVYLNIYLLITLFIIFIGTS